jgi:hypothetical protein
MYKEYKDIDLSKTLSIQENLRKSIVVTTGSSLIAAFIFLFVFVITKNLWMLSLGIILAISGFAFMFVIKNLQRKWVDNYIEKPKSTTYE